ncbi:LmrA/YxaF family transcription factor [Streptomyces sp. 8N706]|uniref:LmrA/YxaF family transcription factor n=1 Tax=Streptomyces sp. 8N706 TaxID=3457416 RepID=UPI003FCFDD09
MKQIVAAADAPYGSAYHFFVGGKAQLGEEVIRTSGAACLRLIADLFQPGTEDMATATATAFTAAAETLRALDFADPCPVASAALEVASTHEPLRRATAEVFADWTDTLAEYYAEGDIIGPAAQETASSVRCHRRPRGARPVRLGNSAAADGALRRAPGCGPPPRRPRGLRRPGGVDAPPTSPQRAHT